MFQITAKRKRNANRNVQRVIMQDPEPYAYCCPKQAAAAPKPVKQRKWSKSPNRVRRPISALPQ